MAKDRYTEERNRQEAEKKATEKAEELRGKGANYLIDDAPNFDTVPLHHENNTDDSVVSEDIVVVDPDTIPEVSLDPDSFGYGSVDAPGTV